MFLIYIREKQEIPGVEPGIYRLRDFVGSTAMDYEL